MWDSFSATYNGGFYSTAAPLFAVTNRGGTLGGTTDSVATYTFPASLSSGLFLVVLAWVGSNAGNNAGVGIPSIVTTTNCSQPTLFMGSQLGTLRFLAGAANVVQPVNDANSMMIDVAVVQVTAAGAFFSYETTVPTYSNVSTNSLMLTQLDPAFVN